MNTNEIIAAASLLPISEQTLIATALFNNAMAEDFGPEGKPGEVEAEWSEELSRRIADIKSGRVTTISADAAKSMICHGDHPDL